MTRYKSPNSPIPANTKSMCITLPINLHSALTAVANLTHLKIGDAVAKSINLLQIADSIHPPISPSDRLAIKAIQDALQSSLASPCRVPIRATPPPPQDS